MTRDVQTGQNFVRFPQDNNPWWPLPVDYPTLTERGRRLARLNVLYTQETPADIVTAWDFFDRTYLIPTPEGFFYVEHKPTPLAHYEMVRDIATHRRNLFIAPRGGGKSLCYLKLLLLFLTTRPYFSVLWGHSVDRIVERRFATLRDQLENNPALIADFGPQRGPDWNLHFMRLTNGANVVGYSLDGKKRGEHPRLILLDDLESDPAESTDAIKVIRGLDRQLTRVFLPMIDAGSGLAIVGTMISRKMFLYNIATSDDPRFSDELWNKRVWSAEWTKDDGTTGLYWPERWTPTVLAQQRLEMGEAAYAAEKLNAPVSDHEKILRIDPLLNTYTIDGWQSDLKPFANDTSIIYHDDSQGAPEPVLVKKPLTEFLKHTYRFMTVDYAPTVGPLSDFSAAHVMALDSKNTLWSLDLFLGKVRQETLIRTIWELATKWRCRVVGVEAVSVQQELFERVQTDLGILAIQAGWTPHVIPITYPSGLTKESRIAGLEWRFNRGRVKLPSFRRNETYRGGLKPYGELFQQIDDFTLDLALLKHDDALDTMAMVAQVLKPRHVDSGEGPRRISTPEEHILEGNFDFHGTGASPFDAMNASELTPAMIAKIQKIARALDEPVSDYF